MNPNRILIAAGGFLAGLLIVLFLPSSWLFAERGPEAGAHADHDEEDAQYACPMRCVVVDELPEDERCPVCGMELTEVSSANTLSGQEQAMIGLDVGLVRRLPLVKTIRLVGEVDYDETRLARVTSRMAGWLEKVFVQTTWTDVEKGEKLFSIYSPELYEAQQDLLVAVGAGSGGRHRVDETLLRASRRRLALLGVSEEEIREIEEGGEVARALTIRAPRGGIVTERRAVEDEFAKKGDVLYTIADLDRVWIQTEVFENDLPWVRAGQEVRIRTETLGEPMAARVAFVDPVIDRKTRTARVRIEVENRPGPDGRRPLRVGQRVDAWIEARLDAGGGLVPPGEEPEADPLAVPRGAILKTGERSVAYVLFTEHESDHGPMRDYELDPDRLPETVWYEMIEVRVGPLAKVAGRPGSTDHYPLMGLVGSGDPAGLDELREGVTIVTSGNLLLDSQAQLSGKPSLLFPEGNRGAPPDDPHAGH